ncbi:MAG: tetratricopeptide repeat protein [Iamia sp.]
MVLLEGDRPRSTDAAAVGAAAVGPRAVPAIPVVAAEDDHTDHHQQQDSEPPEGAGQSLASPMGATTQDLSQPTGGSLPSPTDRPARRGPTRPPRCWPRRAVASALVALLVASAACSSDQDGGSVSRDAEIPFIEVDPDSTSPTDRAIEEAQATLRDDPTDPNAQLDLAQAFLQKGRETADPTLYTSAEILLEKVAVVAPDDPRVLNAQGSLALTRHLFTDAWR